MYKIKNMRTGKFTKDAITGKVLEFADREEAQYRADSAARDSVLSASAWNSVRKSSYEVISDK